MGPSHSKKSAQHGKTNPLLEPDSEEEELGQDRVHSPKCINKFSGSASRDVGKILDTSKLLPSDVHALCKDLEKLVVYSTSTQSWARHCSAWNLYNSFCIEYRLVNKLPVPVGYARAFVTWAITKKGLKSNTVKSYLSSINTAHALSGNDRSNFNSDPCIKLALKGASNLNSLLSTPKPVRLPMNIHLLDVLGDRISKLGWTVYSKQVLWAACTACFFSSCRMGELLPFSENAYDPRSTLLWKNGKIMSEDKILMLIPYCKTKGFAGKLVDLYPIIDDGKCPVAAIHLLKKLACEMGIYDGDRPVFAFKSGKNLTTAKLNKILNSLIGDFCDSNHTLTGHSFRAAIPSLLTSHPDQHSIAELKEWGNWESDCFKLYTKNEREKRRVIFKKIVKCMYM